MKCGALESFLKNQKTPRSYSQFRETRAAVRDRDEKKPASIFIDAGYRLVSLLQRTQEVEKVLFFALWEAIEISNYAVCLRPCARMRLNRLQQVGRSSIMQEKNSLP